MDGVKLSGVVLDPAPVKLAFPNTTAKSSTWNRAGDDPIEWAAPHVVVTRHSYAAPNGAFKNDVVLWDATTGKSRSKGIPGVAGGPFTSPHDIPVVAGDNTMQAFDATTGKKVASLKGHKDAQVKAVIRRDGYVTGSRALARPADRTLRFWGLDGSPEQKHKLEHDVIALAGGLDGPLYAVLQSPYVKEQPYERFLTCFGEQGEVRWQRQLRSSAERLALSPGGDLLALLHGSGPELVRAEDGEPVRALSISPMPHWDALSTMFFSPDGRWLGSTVRGANFTFVWDVRTGHRVNLLRAGHLAFSGDGSRVAGRVLDAGDGFVHVWDGDYVLQAFPEYAKEPE